MDLSDYTTDMLHNNQKLYRYGIQRFKTCWQAFAFLVKKNKRQQCSSFVKSNNHGFDPRLSSKHRHDDKMTLAKAIMCVLAVNVNHRSVTYHT